MPNKNSVRRNNAENRAKQVKAQIAKSEKELQRARKEEKQLLPPGTFSTAGGALGGTIGGLLPGPFGALGKLGGQHIGRLLGSGLAKITGFGDYTVHANTLAHPRQLDLDSEMIDPGLQPPSFEIGNAGAVRVLHKEFVKDIKVPNVAALFSNQSMPINPGNAELFPWLSSVARGFQQFRIRGMLVVYKSLSSDISAGGPLGSVMIATNYDVLSPPFQDKRELENSEYAVSTKPSKDLLHTIECEPSQVAQKLYYVHSDTDVSLDADRRLSDLGTLQVATAGLPGTADDTLGELWVTYDIELHKPKLSAVDTAYINGSNGPNQGPANPFGDDWASTSFITGNFISQDTDDPRDFTFNVAGTYAVACTATGLSVNTYPAIVSLDVPAGAVTSDYWKRVMQDAAALRGSSTIVVRVQSGWTIRFETSDATTTVSEWQAVITPISNFESFPNN